MIMVDSRKPKPVKPGDPVTAAMLEKFGQNLLQRIRVAGGSMTRIGNGYILDTRGRSRGGGAMTAAHFRIWEEDDDWCKGYRINTYEWNTDTAARVETLDDSELIYLAKPPELQRTEYEGEVDGSITWSWTDENERDAADGVDTESQIIVPPFLLPAGDFEGKKVMAVKGVAGGTGVFYDDGTGAMVEAVWQIVGPYAFAKKST